MQTSAKFTVVLTTLAPFTYLSQRKWPPNIEATSDQQTMTNPLIKFRILNINPAFLTEKLVFFRLQTFFQISEMKRELSGNSDETKPSVKIKESNSNSEPNKSVKKFDLSYNEDDLQALIRYARLQITGMTVGTTFPHVCVGFCPH